MGMTRITTGRSPEQYAEEGAVPEIAMTMTMAGRRRTERAVRQGPGPGREELIGRGKGRGLRTGWGKGRGRGKETVKGKVL